MGPFKRFSNRLGALWNEVLRAGEWAVENVMGEMLSYWGVDFMKEAPLAQEPSITFSRATGGTVTDCYGNLLQALPNELRIEGARRVANYVTYSEDWTHSPGYAGHSAVSAKSVTLLATDGYSYKAVNGAIAAGDTYVVSMTISSPVTHQVGLRVTVVAEAKYVLLTVTPTPTRFTLIGTTTVGGTFHFGLEGRTSVVPGVVSGNTYTIENVQLERAIPGQTEASEYVSSGVLSAPWHGYGCDGVSYFNSYRNDDLLLGAFPNVSTTSTAALSAADADGWATISKTVTTTSESMVLSLSSGTFIPPMTAKGAAVRVELLAGSADAMQLGMYSPVGAWTAICGARIVSGPGIMTASSLSLRHIYNLSQTVPTVVELWRVYTSDQTTRSVYIYPGTTASTTVGHSIKVRNLTIHSGAQYPIGPMPAVGQTLPLPDGTWMGALTEPAAYNPVLHSNPAVSNFVPGTEQHVVDATPFLNFPRAVSFSEPTGVSQFPGLYASLAASITYTMAVYVATDDGLPPVCNGDVATSNLLFFFGPDPVTGPYLVEPVRGNVYRVSATGVTPSTAPTAVTVGRRSTMAVRAMRFAGFQVDGGELVTSLVPTNGAAASRNADYLRSQVPPFPWKNSDATLFLEAQPLTAATKKPNNQVLIGTWVDANNRTILYNNQSTAGTMRYSIVAGVGQPLPYTTGWTHRQQLRLATTFGFGKASVFMNGVKFVGSANIETPPVNVLVIGGSSTNGSTHPQITKRVAYINQLYSDDALKAITQ